MPTLITSGLSLALSLVPQGTPAGIQSLGQSIDDGLLAPRLALVGLPVPSSSFALRVVDGPSGGFGNLLVGESSQPVFTPVLGGLLYPAGALQLLPFVLDSDGASGELLAMPTVPATLAGQRIVVQAVTTDPGSEGYGATRGTEILFGDASGLPTFPSVQQSFPVTLTSSHQHGLWDVAAGDLNGNDQVDLVGITPRRTVFVFLSREDGTRIELPRFTVEERLRGVTLLDVTQDGRLDLLATSYEGNLIVYEGQGDGTFEREKSFAVSDRPGPMILEDFNGDGQMDVGVIDIDFVTPDDGQVTVLLADDDQLLRIAWSAKLGRLARWLQAGDLDRDGILDIVTVEGSREIQWCRGLGDGTFEDPVVMFEIEQGFDVPEPVCADLGDFDRDGFLDIAVACRAKSTFPDFLEIRFGLGGGSFDEGTRITIANPTSPSSYQPEYEVHVTDLNGDRLVDIAVADELMLEVLFGNGDGTFGAPQAFGQAPNIARGLTSLVILDTNGDLLPDVVSGTPESFPSFVILENQGFGQARTTQEVSGRASADLLGARGSSIR